MNDLEFDLLLHDALVLAAAKRFNEVPESEVVISPQYQRKYAKMLKDPLDYAKKFQETLGCKFRRYALTAILVLAILSAAIFAIPQTRVWAINVLTHWYKDFVSFSFVNESAEHILPDIEIGYIPDGYELVYESNNAEIPYKKYEYRDKNNNLLNISILTTHTDATFNYDNQHRQLEYLTLENGLEIQFLKAIDDDWPSVLIWSSIDNKFLFNIEGCFPKENLLDILNGISIK